MFGADDYDHERAKVAARLAAGRHARLLRFRPRDPQVWLAARLWSRVGVTMWGMFAGGARLPGPFEGRDAARRIGPFALVVAGGFVLVPAQRHGSVTELLLAAAGSLVPIGLALWVPWKRVPRWLQALPLLAYLVWVAFLRDYCGGGASGYSALVLLPILWLALYGGPAELVASIVGAFLILSAPILLVGTPKYPGAGEWRKTTVLVAIGSLAGFAIRRLVAERSRREALLKESEALARAEARRLDAVLRGVTGYAIIGGGLDGMTYFNRGAELMLGYDAAEVVGRHTAA